MKRRKRRRSRGRTTDSEGEEERQGDTKKPLVSRMKRQRKKREKEEIFTTERKERREIDFRVILERDQKKKEFLRSRDNSSRRKEANLNYSPCGVYVLPRDEYY